MSFSSDVKKEIAGIPVSESHCKDAELMAFHVLFSDSAPDERKLQKECCKRAFLRGIFLMTGLIGDPEKAYRLEFSLESPAVAAAVQKILVSFDLYGKILERKGKYVVYLKDSDQIVDFLAQIGASRSLLALENVRVVKDVRNAVNRKVNCETANLNKTVSAGVSQVRSIEKIEARYGLSSLPAGLREIAVLRLEHPDATLQELGALMEPPMGKSGVNHRLRRLMEIAEEGTL